ncbi:MAG: hypothetical protein O2816_09135 [Planctomycetota bacterium]|nr:hypothetical protein [Planctomycetota bacterium]
MASPEMIALYEKLLATHLGIERKGAKNPYTSHNGHMFSFLTSRDSLAIRLDKPDVEAFREKYKTGPVIEYNATMRGYVEVPPGLLKKGAELKQWLVKSWEYIGSLEPKPTTKKQAGAKKPAAKKKAAKKPVAKKPVAKKAPARKKPASKQQATKKPSS